MSENGEGWIPALVESIDYEIGRGRVVEAILPGLAIKFYVDSVSNSRTALELSVGDRETYYVSSPSQVILRSFQP